MATQKTPAERPKFVFKKEEDFHKKAKPVNKVLTRVVKKPSRVKPDCPRPEYRKVKNLFLEKFAKEVAEIQKKEALAKAKTPHSLKKRIKKTKRVRKSKKVKLPPLYHHQRSLEPKPPLEELKFSSSNIWKDLIEYKGKGRRFAWAFLRNRRRRLRRRLKHLVRRRVGSPAKLLFARRKVWQKLARTLENCRSKGIIKCPTSAKTDIQPLRTSWRAIFKRREVRYKRYKARKAKIRWPYFKERKVLFTTNLPTKCKLVAQQWRESLFDKKLPTGATPPLRKVIVKPARRLSYYSLLNHWKEQTSTLLRTNHSTSQLTTKVDAPSPLSRTFQTKGQLPRIISPVRLKQLVRHTTRTSKDWLKHFLVRQKQHRAKVARDVVRNRKKFFSRIGTGRGKRERRRRKAMRERIYRAKSTRPRQFNNTKFLPIKRVYKSFAPIVFWGQKFEKIHQKLGMTKTFLLNDLQQVQQREKTPLVRLRAKRQRTARLAYTHVWKLRPKWYKINKQKAVFKVKRRSALARLTRRKRYKTSKWMKMVNAKFKSKKRFLKWWKKPGRQYLNLRFSNRPTYTRHLVIRALKTKLSPQRVKALLKFLESCVRRGIPATKEEAANYLYSQKILAPSSPSTLWLAKHLVEHYRRGEEKQARIPSLQTHSHELSSTEDFRETTDHALTLRAIRRSFVSSPLNKATLEQSPRDLTSLLFAPSLYEENEFTYRASPRVDWEPTSTEQADYHNVSDMVWESSPQKISLPAVIKATGLEKQRRHGLSKWRRPGSMVPLALRKEALQFDHLYPHRPISIKGKRKILLPAKQIWTIGPIIRSTPAMVQRWKQPIYRPLRPSRLSEARPISYRDKKLLDAIALRKRVKWLKVRATRKLVPYHRQPKVVKVRALRVKRGRIRTAHLVRGLKQSLRTQSNSITKFLQAIKGLSVQRLLNIRRKLLACGKNLSAEWVKYTLLKVLVKNTRDIRIRRRALNSLARIRVSRPHGAYSRLTLLHVTGESVLEKKERALWYAKNAVQTRLEARKRLPWIKHYNLSSRRLHTPRLNGIALARQWVTRKVQRERALLDEALARRNLPAKRYPDCAPVLLQNRYGTPATEGYTRLRRVYRTRTPNNRWWHPSVRPLPLLVANSQNREGYLRKVTPLRLLPLLDPLAKKQHKRKRRGKWLRTHYRPFLYPTRTEVTATEQIHLPAPRGKVNINEGSRWRALDKTATSMDPLLPSTLDKRTRSLLSRYQSSPTPTGVDPKKWVKDSLLHVTRGRKINSKRLEYKRLRKQNRLWHQSLPKNISMLDKEGSNLYRRWLQGAEAYLKHSSVSYLAPEDGRLIELEQDRKRFPGSGYRRETYDRAVHSFIKRLAPSRLRRVMSPRFQFCRPSLLPFFKLNVARYGLTRTLRLRRARLQGYSRSRYLSKSAREASNVIENDTKRRFAPLPYVQVIPKSCPIPMRTYRSGLLRLALRERVVDRRFTDLKDQLERRRPPREYLPNPWVITKQNRLRARYQAGGRLGFIKKLHKNVFWTVKSFNFLQLARQNRSPIVQTELGSGELIGLKMRPYRNVKYTQPLSPVISRKVVKKVRRPRARKKFVELMQELGRAENRRIKQKYRRQCLRVGLVAKLAYPRKARKIRDLILKATYLRARLKPAQSFTFSRLNKVGRTTSENLYNLIQKRKHRRLLRWSPRVKPQNWAPQVENSLPLPALEEPQKIWEGTIAPLLFQNPIKQTIKTAGTQQMERDWNITSKEIRYKRTAQYTEAITSQFPRLIDKIVNADSLEEARGQVAATYWSLRAMMAVDTNRVLGVRDHSMNRLSMLGEEMEKKAIRQDSFHAERSLLRKRYQPGQIIRTISSDRFRHDWLRQFFPRKHAVFIEDPNDYKDIPLSTHQIRHVSLGRELDSTPITTSDESASLQILNMGFSISTPRVETMLQTIRRRPASNMPIVSNHKFAPKLFFARAYSTTSRVTKYMYRETRLGAKENPVSFFKGLTQSHQTKIRSEKKSKLGFTSDSQGFSLDPRFLRSKSPRSRQYKGRVSDTNYRPTEIEKSEPEALFQSARRYVSEPSQEITARRLQLTLQLRGRNENRPLLTREQANAARSIMMQNKLIPESSPELEHAWVVEPHALRKADQRLETLPRPPHVAISSTALSLVGDDKGTTCTAAHTLLATRRYHSTRIQGLVHKAPLNSLIDYTRPLLWRKLTSQRTKKERYVRYWLKVVKRLYKHLWTAPRQGQFAWKSIENQVRKEMRRRVRANLRKASNRVGRYRPMLRRRTVRLTRRDEHLVRKITKARFKEYALWVTGNHPKFTKRANDVSYFKETRKAPYRIGTRAYHPLVFKEMLRRIRPLEWRESDERFFRRGFRNAFSFNPSQKKAAGWLEPLLLSRATYISKRGEHRRHQFPREQKRFKWLYTYMRSLAPIRIKYIKGRHWPKLSIYLQRLNRTLLAFPHKRAAQKEFRKLRNRNVGKEKGFGKLMGRLNRLDNVLVLLRLLPSIHFARKYANQGLLRVNGKIVSDPSQHLAAGDCIQVLWRKVSNLQAYFNNQKFFPGAIAKHFAFDPGTKIIRLLRAPTEEDFIQGSRHNPKLLWMYSQQAIEGRY